MATTCDVAATPRPFRMKLLTVGNFSALIATIFATIGVDSTTPNKTLCDGRPR